MEERIVETLEGFVVMMNLTSNFSLTMKKRDHIEIEIFNHGQYPAFMKVFNFRSKEVIVTFQCKTLDSKQQKIKNIVRQIKVKKEFESFSNVDITTLVFDSTDEFLSFMTAVLMPKLETI